MAHKVKFPYRRRNRDTLIEDLESKEHTLASAETELIFILDLAGDMAQLGYLEIDKVYSTVSKDWVDNWNNNEVLVKWFGTVDSQRHVRKVYRRMKSVRDRLRKDITVRLRPDGDNTGSARSAGWFAEPKTFKAFSNFLDKDRNSAAGTVIHELIHLWFRDQRIDSVKVYGPDLAIDLASTNARKARRNPDNYAEFVREVTILSVA